MVTILVVYQGKNQRHLAYERFPDGSLMYFPSHEADGKVLPAGTLEGPQGISSGLRNQSRRKIKVPIRWRPDRHKAEITFQTIHIIPQKAGENHENQHVRA